MVALNGCAVLVADLSWSGSPSSILIVCTGGGSPAEGAVCALAGGGFGRENELLLSALASGVGGRDPVGKKKCNG